MQDYEKLRAWKDAHRLVLSIYEISRSFPKHEQYGLTTQIRRAALSIASNMAEGAGRATAADLARFLDISTGSANEVQYQLLVAKDLGWLDESTYAELRALVGSVRRQTHALKARIRRNASGTSTSPQGERKTQNPEPV